MSLPTDESLRRVKLAWYREPTRAELVKLGFKGQPEWSDEQYFEWVKAPIPGFPRKEGETSVQYFDRWIATKPKAGDVVIPKLPEIVQGPAATLDDGINKGGDVVNAVFGTDWVAIGALGLGIVLAFTGAMRMMR